MPASSTSTQSSPVSTPTTSDTAAVAVGAVEDTPPHRYTAALAGDIEQYWQDRWAEQGVFSAPNPVGELAAQPGTPVAERAEWPKLFVQDMFPYPSGAGLHVGHPLGYIATDVFARFARMNCRNVLHTLGYDAFGLPAEQYAVQTGQHPRVTTEANIANMRSQLTKLGLGHDRRRSIATTDTAYYRWTQWIFLQIFNSWYDRDQDRARPIAELIEQFASGARPTPAGRPWAELSSTQQRVIVNEHRLAYVSDAPVNWCPGLGTVLSNEEVTADGRSERGNFPVFKRRLRQWMMRITDYADRLIDDLEQLDWPEPVVLMQRNWIGRSYGARVDFAIDGGPAEGAETGAEQISVFTTRPDTLFGATYLVLAPEHPLVERLVPEQWPAQTPAEWTGGAATPIQAVVDYRARLAAISDTERQSDQRAKTGVFTGGYAINPVNGERIPIFVADYVLMGYGTGVIMAVPGQDQRDWDFAVAYQLPIVRTVAPPEDFAGEAYTGEGPGINSASSALDLNGLHIAEAKERAISWLTDTGHGRGTVSYKLRDWLFSRQRYWGEPFPIVYDADGQPIALDDSALPVLLPEVDDYSPVSYDPEDANSEPSPPLAKARDWIEVELDLGDGPKTYYRDANVMPNWAGSCFYQLRYIDPVNSDQLCDPVSERYWMGPDPLGHGPADPGGVDLYVGGVEHAVLHLLYARFWHKVLFDLGHVSSSEPYRKLFNQGYIQAPAYTDERGVYVPAAEVVEIDGQFSWNGRRVHREYGKMGKSLKNVVTPEEMCAEYGADTFRVYEMSMGPLENSRPWESRAVVGAHRFLQRLWRVVLDEQTGEARVTGEEPSADTLRVLHRTIEGVRADMANLRFNTVIAKLIELTNHVTTTYPGGAPRAVAEPLVLMTAPLAPHIAEELWQLLGHDGSLTYAPFPAADPALLVADTVEYPVQVNGKVRARVTVSADAAEATVRQAALAEPKVAGYVGDREPKKVIVVLGRIVTVVV
ncbi:MAG: leucine--tRNA ligase [Mycobacteriales bacterium]